MQVQWNKKGSCWKHFLEHMEAMHEGVCHVATFQHRDAPHVVTFQCRDVGSTNTEVNNQKRRDASTLRRLNVTTLQRRDVSTGSAPHHLKHQWFRMRGIGRRTNEGTEFQSSSDTAFEEVPMICTVSNFWILG